MNRRILIFATILGLLSIILGAFASHGLENLINEAQQDSFETGVRYQLYHAFFLLIIGTTNKVRPKIKKVLFYLILMGIIFFSFSIYGLSTNELTSFDFKSIAFITPIGGLFLIISWLILLVEFIKTVKD